MFLAKFIKNLPRRQTGRKKLIISFVILICLFIYLLPKDIKINLYHQTASVFFVDSIDPAKLKEKPLVKILIVPGHDNEYWGTEHKGVKEADLNVELAEYLYDFLKNEERFDVSLLRDSKGYDAEYLDYFNGSRQAIFGFLQRHKKIMNTLIQVGILSFEEPFSNGIGYSQSVSKVASNLYGINKWSNEHEMDIVLHIHFNDYYGRPHDKEGKYSGLTIYVPEKQYSNAKASRSLAESISENLGRLFAYSNLPFEEDDQGIVENQEFIATGSYNTLDAVGLLIEYGYIYEPKFMGSGTRKIVLQEMASQTYFGIKKYFNEIVEDDEIFVLPHRWDYDLKYGMQNSVDIFALQMFLNQQGFYPPKWSNLSNCPISGYFGSCTLKSVKEFQKNNNIEPANGLVGPLTREKLNEIK